MSTRRTSPLLPPPPAVPRPVAPSLPELSLPTGPALLPELVSSGPDADSKPDAVTNPLAAPAPTLEIRPPARSFHSLPDDRWCLRLELKDDEIARLYSQGLTRGALVWRAGMPEWRPLLITPELSNLLHRTRITLADASEASLLDEVTLPRPARLPNDVERSELASESAREFPTVAPTALDVAPSAPSRPRRRGELLAVAALGFGLAWFSRGGGAQPVPEMAAAIAPLPPQAVLTAPPPLAAEPASSIPLVAVTDLPMLGGSSSPAPVSGGAKPSSAKSRTATAAGAPSRAELMAALGRVASAASGCGERGGPVRVVVTFNASGVARSIQVSGKGLPAPVRSCIIGAASRARVSAFTGDPVTVSKTL